MHLGRRRRGGVSPGVGGFGRGAVADCRRMLGRAVRRHESRRRGRIPVCRQPFFAKDRCDVELMRLEVRGLWGGAGRLRASRLSTLAARGWTSVRWALSCRCDSVDASAVSVRRRSLGSVRLRNLLLPKTRRAMVPELSDFKQGSLNWRRHQYLVR